MVQMGFRPSVGPLDCVASMVPASSVVSPGDPFELAAPEPLSLVPAADRAMMPSPASYFNQATKTIDQSNAKRKIVADMAIRKR